jgi:8-oxo-dGTP diphosphatase
VRETAQHPGHGTGQGTERGTGRAEPPVLAAGAVVWRRSPFGGHTEVALVHRPKYDDWSFPKGKLHRGESPRQGALREVKEETGLDCVLGAPLPTSRYLVHGRPKEVRYWEAVPTGGSFTAGDEVDRMVWLPVSAARRRLTHGRDRPLLDALVETLNRS